MEEKRKGEHEAKAFRDLSPWSTLTSMLGHPCQNVGRTPARLEPSLVSFMLLQEFFFPPLLEREFSCFLKLGKNMDKGCLDWFVWTFVFRCHKLRECSIAGLNKTKPGIML